MPVTCTDLTFNNYLTPWSRVLFEKLIFSDSHELLHSLWKLNFHKKKTTTCPYPESYKPTVISSTLFL